MSFVPAEVSEIEAIETMAFRVDLDDPGRLLGNHAV
jgi:hypothetical protein